MKRAAVAAALLVLVAALAAFAGWRTVSVAERTEAAVTALLRQQEASAPEALRAQAERLTLAWRRQAALLRCLADRGRVDAITEQMETLPAFSADPAEFRRVCVRTAQMLSALAAETRLRPENLL